MRMGRPGVAVAVGDPTTTVRVGVAGEETALVGDAGGMAAVGVAVANGDVGVVGVTLGRAAGVLVGVGVAAGGVTVGEA